MKILITGASGYIGKHIFQCLKKYNPVGTSFTKIELNVSKIHGNNNLQVINLLDELEVKRLIQKTKPEIVFHLAGYTNEDHTNKEKELNFDLTRTLINNLDDNTHVVFLSTDKVFNGSIIEPDEFDEPKPKSVYGRQKYECEKLIKLKCNRYHIFRLPIVHSFGDSQSRCFIDRAMINLSIGNQVKAFSNVKRSFIRLTKLLEILELTLSNNRYGIYHAGTSMVSYFERIKNLSEEKNINYQDKLIPCIGQVDPLKQGLNTMKVKKTFKVNFE